MGRDARQAVMKGIVLAKTARFLFVLARDSVKEVAINTQTANGHIVQA